MEKALAKALAYVISAGIVRLRRLDPYCRPKLRRARFMDLLGPDPHRDWAPERFRRVLGIIAWGGDRAAAVANGHD
jgi:hypothetical protein